MADSQPASSRLPTERRVDPEEKRIGSALLDLIDKLDFVPDTAWRERVRPWWKTDYPSPYIAAAARYLLGTAQRARRVPTRILARLEERDRWQRAMAFGLRVGREAWRFRKTEAVMRANLPDDRRAYEQPGAPCFAR
jgi:hypothetical protein